MNNNINLLDYSISHTTKVNSSIRNSRRNKTHSSKSNICIYVNKPSKNHIDTNIKSNNINNSSNESKIETFYYNYETLLKLQQYGFFTDCMKPLNRDSEISISKEGYIDTSNHITCKNRLCPHCSKQYHFKERKKLLDVMNEYKSKHNKSVLFLTLTLPKYKNNKSIDIFGTLKDSFSQLLNDSKFKYTQIKIINSKNSRAINSISHDLALDGIYSHVDYTYSLEYGSNFHLHIALFCNKSFNESEIISLRARINELWYKHISSNLHKKYPNQHCLTYSKSFKKYAVNLQDATNSPKQISYYISKNLAYELTDTKNKIARSSNSFTISELYKMLDTNNNPMTDSQIIAVLTDFFRTIKNKRLSQYYRCNDSIKKIIEESKEELKQQKKEYINKLKLHSSIEITNNYVRNNIKNEYILNTHTSHIRRVLSSSSINTPFNAISLNNHARSLNKGIVLNACNQSTNKINKLAPNKVIVSNREAFFKNTS